MMEASRGMDVFARVVDEGGFSAAARALDLTPSAVSRIVTRLEEHLGVRLLNRTTRSLRLTAEGETYYRRCRAILRDIEDAEEAVGKSRNKAGGVLRVLTTVAFGNYQLVPLVPEFLARNPDIRLDLNLFDGPVDLRRSGDDVAVLYGRVPDSSLIMHRLCDDRRFVVAAPAYLERHGVPKTPEDLLDHHCLRWGSGQRHLNDWPFDGNRIVPARGPVEANNGETLFRLLLAGVGLMRLAEFVAGAAIREGRLVPVLAEFTQADSLPIFALYQTRRHVPLRIRAFLDFLSEKFSPEPPWRGAPAPAAMPAL
jgi:DNA-binding transcriptional LysR family regulator